ncbi:hypothetical protein [Segatella baroniae]|uniref:hypothetical protein n=1 Tax=Segatella baroniae TaxID=305719 RepID=UPI0012B559FB|nr:hypothetical protein [Segatella baroniae]
MKEWEAHSGLPLFLLLGHEGCAVAPPNGRIQRDFPLREMLHQEPFRKDWSHAHNTKSRQGKDTCGAGLPQAQAHVFAKAALSPDKSTALTSPKLCSHLLKAVISTAQSSAFTYSKLWFDTPKAVVSPVQSFGLTHPSSDFNCSKQWFHLLKAVLSPIQSCGLTRPKLWFHLLKAVL